MIISIVLTHNKGARGNEEQIRKMISMVDDHDILGMVDDVDDEGNKITEERRVGHYYTLKDLPDHHVKFLHIVPFGVERPSNMDELDGHKVLYGKGDEDKTGDHPRFYNWGLKRGTDLGGDVVLHIDNVSRFKPAQFSEKLGRLASKDELLNFLEEPFGKASTRDLIVRIGQLKEEEQKPIDEFKRRIREQGLIHG